MSQNSPALIQDVLTLRRAEVPYKHIASVVNEKYNLEGDDVKSEEAVRHIWREHGDKVAKKVPFRMSGRFGVNVPLEMEENFLVIPDLHMPFMLKGFIDFLLRTQKKYALEKVFGIGDAFDHHAISFWDNAPGAEDALNEYTKAKEQANLLAEAFPSVKWVLGNHDLRYLRIAHRQGIPDVYLRDVNEIFEMPETWVWHTSYVINGNILIEHGDGSGPRTTYDRAWGTSKNVIQGHTHNYGGVLYMNDGFNRRWALNVGCGVDEYSYGMTYSLHRKYKATLGCGVVLEGVPYFVPYDG